MHRVFFSDSKSVASIVGDLKIIEAMANLTIQDDDILSDSDIMIEEYYFVDGAD